MTTADFGRILLVWIVLVLLAGLILGTLIGVLVS
jgi:hypothetical protein